MNLKIILPALSSAALAAGCFAHREAPHEPVTANGLDEARASAAVVERVILNGARLAEVPPELASMPNLRILFLRGSSVTNLEGLSALKGVETLDLAEVRLGGEAPAALAYLPALRELYLSDCGLTSFPAFLAKSPSLRYLNLDRNALAEIPGDGLPPALRWLRLNSNRLTGLPDAIGGLADLQRLYVRGNRLTELPDSLASLSSLEDIAASDNAFTNFPPVLLRIPKLRNLDLRNCRGIASLPEGIGEMKALRALTLTGCPISKEERDRIRAALPKGCVLNF